MKAKSGRMQKFLRLLLSMQISKRQFFWGLLGSILTTVVGLAIPLFVGNIINELAFDKINPSILVAVIVAFILRGVIDGVSGYLLSKTGQQMVLKLRERLWEKMLRLPVSYYDATPSGDSVSRVINDTGIVRDLITYSFPQSITGIISIVGAVTILLLLDWQMTLVMLSAIPVLLFLIIPLGRKMGKISKEVQTETAKFSGEIQQTFSEIRLMKSSTAEKVEEKRGLKGLDRLLEIGLKETRIQVIVGPLIYFVVMANIVLILTYGGIRVANGTLSAGALTSFMLYLFQIIYPVTSFAFFYTQLNRAMGATDRMMDILVLPDEDGQKGMDLDITNLPLIFDHVSFRYKEDEPVLKDISFQAEPGMMMAFSGPSGGGKTTLFNLIERFYAPNTGDIRIGDTAIHAISLASWRKQIGYVSQESGMMSGTIRENLIYGLENSGDVSDEQLWQVAALAYAEGFIRNFKDGLDTEVGERGVMLSGGQRQRINIARAFLRNPKILLMDEATASLDSQSEQVVQKALNRLMEGRMTFVIAHRLGTIVNADQILFIEQGEITGRGTHEELKASHPLYRQFAKQQLS